jgi:hypothetical protein
MALINKHLGTVLPRQTHDVSQGGHVTILRIATAAARLS